MMWRYLPLIALVGCSTTAKLTPRSQTVVKSPKLLSVTSADNIQVIIPPPTIHAWTWDWPAGAVVYSNLPVVNVEFDLEHRTTLNGEWSLYCRTNQPPVSFSFTNDQEYFRVGTHYIDDVNGPFYDTPNTGPDATN
jgi:hypothetical protein